MDLCWQSNGSLLFNMLSRFITFLPRSKHLLISWLQSPSAVILEPQKIKSGTVSTVSPSICNEVMGPDTMIKLLIIGHIPSYSVRERTNIILKSTCILLGKFIFYLFFKIKIKNHSLKSLSRNFSP